MDRGQKRKMILRENQLYDSEVSRPSWTSWKILPFTLQRKRIFLSNFGIQGLKDLWKKKKIFLELKCKFSVDCEVLAFGLYASLVYPVNVRTIFNSSLHIEPVFLEHTYPRQLVYSKTNAYINQCLRKFYHILMISTIILKIFYLQS